ncbi:MAG TPA: hypothetical protein VN941_01425 [Bradyrhizobium sp.]|nr:hypothetical protein [Bradyrhizobium sp.]
MTRHERFADKVRVEPRYEVDTLGAPFKVFVLDCVTKKVDPATRKVLTKIPDLIGLIKAVVRSRVTHPRKLNGHEIKFIRNALGIKAIVIADFFEMSAEHLSRCESGAKVMSSLIEKSFRLMMFVASFHPNPEELLIEALQGQQIGETIEKNFKKPDEVSKKFLEQFLTMKIESVYDASEELCFEFTREPFDPNDSNRPEENNEIEWEPKPKLVCYGGR